MYIVIRRKGITPIDKNRTMTITEYHKTILTENAENDGMDLKEYVDHSIENDPTFMTWLFGGDVIQDWGIGMTDEDNTELSEFIDSL